MQFITLEEAILFVQQHKDFKISTENLAKLMARFEENKHAFEFICDIADIIYLQKTENC